MTEVVTKFTAVQFELPDVSLHEEGDEVELEVVAKVKETRRTLTRSGDVRQTVLLEPTAAAFKPLDEVHENGEAQESPPLTLEQLIAMGG